MKITAMKPFIRILSVLLPVLLLASCGGGGGKATDTPTAGRIRVGVDDSYQLLMEAQKYTFETVYKYAKIDTLLRPEADVINDFINDTVPLIVVSRQLSESQVEYLRERQIIPKTTKLAIDGVALILNAGNPDSNLYFQTIREIFQGKITSWKQISAGSKLGKLSVVFDNFKSSNPRYFRERFALDSFPSTCMAAKNNAEVISYVEQNPGAIGVVSVNWISDPSDTVSQKFLQRIRVAGISMEGESGPGTSFYKPYAGYIAEGYYPFTRDVYCINRQTYTGLAYGFSSFMAGEKGQLIVLRSGMVPAAMPVRTVEVKR